MCCGKGGKLNDRFLEREKIKKSKWWKNGGKIKYDITISLISPREDHILGP
jgi:hypothetical protein